MKKILPLIFCLLSATLTAWAQDTDALQFFPKGIRLYNNIAYAQDTLKRHQLDVFLLPGTAKKHPIILWLHSGGWRAGDKQGDMHYMPNTLKSLVKNGYAIVAINYRYSTTAIFPAQIIDCNQALEFVCENGDKYHLDRKRIAIMGFSAGGHLAALMGLSNNSDIPEFYGDDKPHFKISAVVDFFGLSDFYLRPAAEFKNPVSGPGLLFGGAMNDKPALVKLATPLNYIDHADPPFLIIHGDKDDQMDIRQSITLNDSLRKYGVLSELRIIKGAPHGGEMFDADSISNSVVSFLKMYLR